MTLLYDRAPIPPRGSVLEAALNLYAGMKAFREFQKDLAIHGVHCDNAIAYERLKSTLLEAHGLDDKLEKDRHRAEMSEVLNAWIQRGPFTVERQESVDEMRQRMAARNIQNQRAAAVKSQMKKRGVIPEGWRP